MSQEAEIKESVEKLPHNSGELSVDVNLCAAQRTLRDLGGKKGKRRKSRQGYLKLRHIKGRPYWYLVVKIKVNGEWKNKDIYMGAKKPGTKQIEEKLKELRLK